MSKASVIRGLIATDESYANGYATGLKEGARRERRRTKRIIENFAGNWADVSTTCEGAAEKLLRDLKPAARAKRGKG